MKKTIKFLALFTLSIAMFHSCDSSSGLNDGRFDENPEQGWVDFDANTNEITILGTQTSLDVPVQINVPSYPEGFTINYQFEAADGDFSPFVVGTSGSVFADPNAANASDRTVNITINFQTLDQERLLVNSFDIVLTGTDNSNVNAGVDDNSASSSVRYRVNIPCSNPEVLPADYFVGDYAVSDVVAALGPGNGTENFASGTVTLSVNPGNANERVFQVGALPAFNGELETVILTFTLENVVSINEVDPSLSCGGGVPYTFGPADTSNSTPWDICNDNSITVVYTEDPFGSCGGPFAASFNLTKL